MKWIIDDISRALAQLQRWQTWGAIALLGTFAGLAYLVSRFAMRTDFILVYLNRSGGACRELSNGFIIFLFCGMIFFALTSVLTLGEFQQFLQHKERGAHHQARQSLRWGVAWASLAVAITIAALVFFSRYCR